ncbi:phosphopantetheine-binding protein [Streptomyces sp. RB6PN25]|uniref:Phosphopantetheine-binding protein n=1 Tax=Streptomyces humicola TaxID=2953240 RepID=A0ABT1PSE7_9ACTN|nr:phosphopantetheine-binding protein [Streptomyces humicola]MCQ4080601.1 phosphopantetheine-binding protein [Streptomyces humicola]
MTREEALGIVKEAITSIVPDADFDSLAPDERFRDTLELDSLDFLGFVETLSDRTGCRIDEDDYPSLTTLADVADFLTDRCWRTRD